MSKAHEKIKASLKRIKRDINDVKVSSDQERFEQMILTAMTDLGHICCSLEARIAKLEKTEGDK